MGHVAWETTEHAQLRGTGNDDLSRYQGCWFDIITVDGDRYIVHHDIVENDKAFSPFCSV